MADCVVSDVVERLLAHFPHWHDHEDCISHCFGGRNKLKQVEETLRMIQGRLADAEGPQDDEDRAAAVKEWLGRLKCVLYQMEELFEEAGVAEREKEEIQLQIPGGNSKLIRPLCILASKPSLLIVNMKVARQVGAFMGHLAGIISDMHEFEFQFREHEHLSSIRQPNGMLKHSTIDLPVENVIIGRDKDKKRILSNISSKGWGDNSGHFVTVTAICGEDGVGKTTLARLVFYDKSIETKFMVKTWVRVSEVSIFEELLKKILSSITGADYQQLSVEQLETQIGAVVKKFLLVLEDVQDEHHAILIRLLRLLRNAKKAGNIIVTTASMDLPSEVGSIHVLTGLIEDEGWDLLKLLAVKKGQEESNPNLESIGRKIVEACRGIPLAIRIIAAILYAKNTEQEWEHFLHNELRDMRFSGSAPLRILKLGYDQLTPHLKQCFAYCSLFPKGYEFKKTELIYLWMAQGFIELLNGNHQRAERVGNEVFMELLKRNFFKHATRNERGEVISCKMHDFIHNLALEMGRSECLSIDEHGGFISDDIHHVSFIVGSSWEAPSQLLASKQLRSLLLFPRESYTSVTIQNMEELFSRLKCLRALDLGRQDCDCLPISIGELKHFRYLKLGGTLESLPKSITRLHYLQTLDLQACHRLTKIPRGSDKFNKVRLVSGITKHQQFIVGEGSGVNALASLDPVGELEIHFKRRRANAVSESRAANLKTLRVNKLVLEWSSSYPEPDAYADEEQEKSVLQNLQPPQFLSSLVVRFWKSTRFPSYIDLPSLASIEIEGCSTCQHLPPFSRLPSLRYLGFSNLKALEYIEEIGGDSVSNASSAAYFRSLEDLKLEDLPELKGWSREIRQQVFPQLSELQVYLCPKLTSMPNMPRLQSVRVEEIQRKLLNHIQPTKELQPASSTSSTLSTLRKLQIASVHQLNTLSINLPPQGSLIIKRCEELVKLIAESPVFLQRLEIYGCGRLRDISSVLRNLEELKIWLCEKLDLWGMVEGDDGGDHMGKGSSGTSATSSVWQGLTGLRSLTLGSIKKLESLPRGLACLTTLRQLTIFQLRSLRALPEWIGELTQLRRLEIVDCSKMRTLFVASVHEIDLPALTLRIERCQELIDLFGGTLISFKNLEIHRCGSIKDISGEKLTMKELVIEDCDKLHMWDDHEEKSSSRSVIKSLRSLTLQNISKQESLPRGLACLTTLRELKIFQLHNLITLPLSIELLTHLRTLKIKNCPKLTTICILAARQEDSVTVTQVSAIQEWQESFSMISESPNYFKGYLQIGQCGSLKDISGSQLTIEDMQIQDCDELHLWEDEEEGNSHSFSIKNLKLLNISKQESLPRGLSCSPKLEKLKIFQLPNLITLPLWIEHLNHLHYLQIDGCPKLTTIFFHADRKVEYVPVTRISTLIIDRCQELVSMIVESPIHLEYFEVRRCGSIKEIFCQELTIERLEVEECDDLHLWDDKEGGNNRITVIEGLESLKLCNISKLQALPRGLASLTMLQRLCISKLPNLRALPEWIQHLSQLQDLEIAKCSKLTALPESFRELMSLQKFEIRQCNPELKNRCEKATGEDWPKIQHIPTVLIKP